MQRGELVQDRYELEAAVGRGGMADVWRARDLRLEREVAVKFLAPQLADDPDFLVRFFTEAQNVARISSHPSVVDVLDFGQHEGCPYLVMEYVSGGPLSDLVGRPLLPERALEIVAEVARGLHAAHSGGVVHRDIKPANILLDSGGRAKIVDFGIAWTQTGEALTATGAALGTPHYMPPEQVSGGETTALSDVYSVGVVLYELLTGRRPFDGDNVTAVAIARIDREPPPPSFHNAELGPDVDAVVMRCLALDPADRFSSAEDLTMALDELRSGSVAAGGTRAMLGAVSSEEAARPRFLAATIVILLLLFLAGAGVVSRTGGDDPAPEQPAPEREEGPAPRPSSTVADEPALSIVERPSAARDEERGGEANDPAAGDGAAAEEEADPAPDPTPEPTPEPTVEPAETPNENGDGDGSSGSPSPAGEPGRTPPAP